MTGLVHELTRRNARYGLLVRATKSDFFLCMKLLPKSIMLPQSNLLCFFEQAICEGGGTANATIIERL